MEKTRIKSLLETLIFVSEKPLKATEMLEALQAMERAERRANSQAGGEDEGESQDAMSQLEGYAGEEEEKISKSEVVEALQELSESFQANSERGILISEVAGGWQWVTRPENSVVVREFYQPKPTKLSKPGVETLSMVAYRQPITRAEIEEIRGVDSGGVLKTLMEKNLVRIVGKKDEPGKPMLYGTTQEFLELFQLKSLKELPSLKDYRDLEEEFRRKSGEEGLVLENEGEEEESQGEGILELASRGELAPLEAGEEEVLQDLDESIKDVRHMEKEIFAKEEKQEAGEGTVANPEIKEVPTSPEN